jgi:cation:H+ antiporter
MKFEKAPKQILIIPVLAVLLLGLLGLDGQLSRIDGAVLLLGFVLSIIYLIRLSKKGLDIQPTGEVAETLEDAGKLNSGNHSEFLFYRLPVWFWEANCWSGVLRVLLPKWDFRIRFSA